MSTYQASFLLPTKASLQTTITLTAQTLAFETYNIPLHTITQRLVNTDKPNKPLKHIFLVKTAQTTLQFTFNTRTIREQFKNELEEKITKLNPVVDTEKLKLAALRIAILRKDPGLRKLHAQVVHKTMTVTEEEFWMGREVCRRSKIVSDGPLTQRHRS